MFTSSGGSGPPVFTAKFKGELQEWSLRRVKVLGQGSYGVATLAIDESTGLQLVAKEVNLQSVKTAKEVESIYREISILKRVQHPNIVRYVDNFYDGGYILLILMEYCDGGDLHHYIQKYADRRKKQTPDSSSSTDGPITNDELQAMLFEKFRPGLVANNRSNKKNDENEIAGGGGNKKQKDEKGRGPMYPPEDEVASILIQILVALRHLHMEQRILHRDLKPQNIFLMKDGVVKLGDFGVSTVLSQSVDFAKTFCGSPYYLAPELCEEKPYNGKADLWALGVALYELMSVGEKPFSAKNLVALVYQISKAQYEPLSDNIYSSELREIVGYLLQRLPVNRPTFGRLFRLPYVKEHLVCLPKSLLCNETYDRQFQTIEKILPEKMLLELNNTTTDLTATTSSSVKSPSSMKGSGHKRTGSDIDELVQMEVWASQDRQQLQKLEEKQGYRGKAFEDDLTDRQRREMQKLAAVKRLSPGQSPDTSPSKTTSSTNTSMELSSYHGGATTTEECTTSLEATDASLALRRPPMPGSHQDRNTGTNKVTIMEQQRDDEKWGKQVGVKPQADVDNNNNNDETWNSKYADDEFENDSEEDEGQAKITMMTCVPLSHCSFMFDDDVNVFSPK